MIRLYDLAGADEGCRFSPYCWRARMALRHKGLEFETVPWRFVEKDAIAFSGQKLVPVLVDGATTVNDSFAIARYLEDAYPDRPSLFGGPVGLGLTLLVKHWVEQTVNGAVLKIILPDLVRSLHEKDKAYFRTSREARLGATLEEVAVSPEAGLPVLHRALAPARLTLASQPYLAGADPAFADHLLFGTLMWARAVSPMALLATDDPVHAWRERMLDAMGGYARGVLPEGC
jgi:glutathione S-transferase